MGRRKGLGRTTAAYFQFTEKCLEAMGMAARGMSYQQIADRQGVHKSTAYRRVLAAFAIHHGRR